MALALAVLFAMAPLRADEALAPAAPLALPAAAPGVFDRVDPGLAALWPRLRVALHGDDGQLKLGSTAGELRVLDGKSGEPVWTERQPGPLLVVPEGGRPPVDEHWYRIQVGAYRDEAAARAQAALFGSRFEAPADAARDAARGVWRVRIGRAASAAELAPLLQRVRVSGITDAFIAAEQKPSAAGRDGTLLLVDAAWQTGRTRTDRLVFVPPPDARVTLDGRPYRGVIEVLRTASGAVLAVNEVALEDYLRGVVPVELGPGAFPELEALKAQAVAARTYAVANLGQFADEGFDLCDTPRCQVYGGAAVEHPLSDRAVLETAGLVLAYGGAPINAMFTSTCGGHTEDVESVFPELAAPYLRGVPCRAPEPVTRSKLVTVTGRPLERRTTVRDAVPDPLALARLVAHGVAPREAFGAAWRAAPLTAAEAALWLGELAKVSGKPLPGRFEGRPTRLALWLWADTVLGPPTEAGGLVLPGDEDLVLQVDDREAIPPGDRLAVAGLFARGIVSPAPDGRLHPADVPSRGEVLGWLVRAAGAFDAFPVREGTLAAGPDGRLTIREKTGARELRLAAGTADLLDEAGSGWHGVERLELLPGDRVVFVDDAAGRTALLGLRERKGSADDRTSPRFRWTVSRDREQLEAKLAELAPVGTLTDLVVLRRGRSGRVASVEVRGTTGRAVVEAFRLIKAIDIPETQFTMEALRDGAGNLKRVLFYGRGWGHGVGLCQYGAYGMALRGATVDEILQHYYTGVTLVPLPQRP